MIIILKKTYYCYQMFLKVQFTCLKYHGFDPCHYFSSPGLSWDENEKNAKNDWNKIRKNIRH